MRDRMAIVRVSRTEGELVQHFVPDRSEARVLESRRALIGHPRYALSCVVRIVIIWTAIRAATLLAGGLIVGLEASLLFGASVCAIVLLDARATRELVYMRNLGLPLRWLIALSAATVVALEALYHAIA